MIDAIFPSDNDCEIPLLNDEFQAKCVEAPVKGWGSLSRASRMKGVWHFYCDDTKFEQLWNDPDKVLNSHAEAMVEVNFSTGDQMPYPVALYQIYRKRWLSRYYQIKGLNIFVDLNVSEPWDEYNLLGVPEGWKAYGTKASDRELKVLERHYDLAVAHAHTSKIQMLVYGGGKKVKGFCQYYGLLHVPDARNAARKAEKH